MTQNPWRAPCAGAAAFLLASTAGATVVTLSALKDNTIYQESGSLSDGAGDFFFAGNTAFTIPRRALVKFAIAGSVPAGATINSATLTLHMSRTASSTNDTVSLHRLLADWGEGTSKGSGDEGKGGPASALDATWTSRFFAGPTWSSAGGDFNAAPSASLVVGTTIAFYSWTGAGLAADVQSWLGAPAANFGWLLKGDENADATARRFDSRTNPMAAYWPVLTVDYTAVPAPATMGVLAGLGVRSRRRQR